MDCRTSVLFALILLVGSSGCVGLKQQTTVKGPQVPPNDFVVKKVKEGPKRPPLPATVAALAAIKEDEAERCEDPAQKRKLRDEARQFYQEALKIDPNFRQAQQGLVRVYSQLDDYERAFDVYRKALAKSPKDHLIWFDQGMCHNRRKDFAEACKCFEKALEFDPENRQYMQTLGFTLARAGQVDASVEMLTRVQGAAMAHCSVARMLKHLGHPEPCRRHLQLALRADPNLAQARQLLEALDNPAAGSGDTQATILEEDVSQ